MEKEKIKKLVKTIYEAANDKQADNIEILDVTNQAAFTDYFVICSGDNKHKIKAIQDNIKELTEKNGFSYRDIEGRNGEEWILIDYTDVIVHIFNNKTREFYDIERLWNDSKKVNVTSL